MIPTESPPVAPDPGEGVQTDQPENEARAEDVSPSPRVICGNGNGKTPNPSKDASQPPLPDEDAPPLPQEDVPQNEDGWDPVWDPNAQAYYFYNRNTHITQWENPRVPSSTPSTVPAPGVAPGFANHDRPADSKSPPRPAGGYDPSIHGNYDPNADYAKVEEDPEDPETNSHPPGAPGTAGPNDYGAAATFNRFTGRWQAASLTSEHFNDENKSKRQMNAYFDVDAAANAHDGKSLKAERSAKKLSRKELKAFKVKRKEKKEEKRRAWLRD